MVTKEQIIEALKEVADPEIGISIVDLGMVKDIEVEGGKARITIALTTPRCPLAEVIKADVEKAVRSVEGIDFVEVEMSAMSLEEIRKLFPQNQQHRSKTPSLLSQNQ